MKHHPLRPAPKLPVRRPLNLWKQTHKFYQYSCCACSVLITLNSPAWADASDPPSNPSRSEVATQSGDYDAPVRSLRLSREQQVETQSLAPSPIALPEESPVLPSSIAVTASLLKKSVPASSHYFSENSSGLEPLVEGGGIDFAQDIQQRPQPTPDFDPELGNLRLQDPVVQTPSAQLSEDTDDAEIDPELGNLRLQEQPLQQPENLDPELGILRLQEQPFQAPSRRRPISLYLTTTMNYLNSDNIISATDPVNDQLFRPSASLFSSAQLGPKTFLSARASGSLVRYADLASLDYDELRFETSLRQELLPGLYGELEWRNQQLFREEDNDRFLNDHSFSFALERRDLLNRRLRLDSFYQFRASFADPEERSRIRNTLGASLLYALQPNLRAGLNYQMTWADFTEQERDDFYGQLLASLSYRLTRNTNLTLYSGVNFGDSSNPNINFNDFIFGASLGVSFRLF